MPAAELRKKPEEILLKCVIALSSDRPINRDGRTRFGFSRPSSRLPPALARRLRGRTTFPLPTLFPFTACGARVTRSALPRTNDRNGCRTVE